MRGHWLIALLLVGCGSASGTFKFDSLRYPASMSAFVHGPDGSMVNKGDLRVIGRVVVEERFWGIVYGWVDITGDVDIGDRLNEQIKAKGGDAVINLTATAAHCSMNNIFLLNWLPVWPGCVNAGIEGQVVRHVPRTGGAADEEPIRVAVVRPDEIGGVVSRLLEDRVNALVAGAATADGP